MPFYNTHLTVLEQCAIQYAQSPAFRIPDIDPVTKQILQWQTITFSQFHADVQHFAKYWTRKFSQDGVPPQSVVGVWIGGMTYVDAVHIYSIVRAGYVPQLFSLRLPNPDVIFELLAKSDGRALIYDTNFDIPAAAAGVSLHMATDVRSLPVDDDVSLPPVAREVNGDETLMIFHTSGSTSGRPKLVRCSYSWWDMCLYKSAQCTTPRNPKRQDVTVWMGSMCHIGQTFMFSGTLQHGSCTIQATSQAFSSAELMDMVTRCNLNRLVQFPPFLAIHIRASRENPKLLAMLKGLDEIFYSGMLLPQDDEKWMSQHGLKVVNCFGSTECGAMLLAKGVEAPLQAIEGTSYGFFPTTSETEGVHQNANTRMLELVILSDSRDCPDPSLRAADGHFHTGDLFIEVAPGRYVSRGRDDDWIKTENSLRCDTKSIEDNARMRCGDLISDCIVVGSRRPSPTLFVEPKGDMDAEALKRAILRQIRPFHARRYLHERISSTNFIVVLPKGTFPRTASKGNIRRAAVEETYKVLLDRIYGVAC